MQYLLVKAAEFTKGNTDKDNDEDITSRQKPQVIKYGTTTLILTSENNN